MSHFYCGVLEIVSGDDKYVTEPLDVSAGAVQAVGDCSICLSKEQGRLTVETTAAAAAAARETTTTRDSKKLRQRNLISIHRTDVRNARCLLNCLRLTAFRLARAITVRPSFIRPCTLGAFGCSGPDTRPHTD